MDKSTLLEMYRVMVLSRALDERVWLLNRQGKAAIVASAQGHEAAQIGSVSALCRGKDQFYLYYRDLAALLALGVTPQEVMLGYMAKAGEPMSGARQFPTHGAYPKYRIYNLSNVVGTNITQAVGAGLASKMRKEDSVTIVYFGDGASSVGDCHEAMNFAAIHKLPVIFFCENNRYAISVHISKQMAVEDVASRAEGYGMPGLVIDGCDIRSVYDATTEAANRARKGEGPTLIEAYVERLLPHTSDDDDRRYRSISDIENAKTRDPLGLFHDELTELDILSKEINERFLEDAKLTVNSATDFAENSDYPGIEDFYDHVYAES